MEQISYKHELLRKSVHMSSLWMVFAIYLLPKTVNICLFFGLLVLNILIEYGYYRKWKGCVKIYGTMFCNILRSKEKSDKFKLSGSPYVLAAALMVTVIFKPEIAVVGLSTMLIADSMAALVGRKLSLFKINGGKKSLGGSIAFLVSAVAVLFFCSYLFRFSDIMIYFGIAGATIAMFAEVYENKIRLDDNFSIPLVVGVFLTIAAGL